MERAALTLLIAAFIDALIPGRPKA